MSYKYIMFDLDGTLTDSFEGITKSFQYALSAYGIEESCGNLRKVIGPPLIDSFCNYYNFDYETGLKAVEKYRERYSKVGWKENVLIDGADKMLREVKNSGKILALATAKPYFYASKIVELFGIDKYFDFVCGAELDGSISTKTQVIEKTLGLLGNPDNKSVLMVGDRIDDVVGASNCGIDCVCIRSGYEDEGELENSNAKRVFVSIESLTDFLVL